MELIETQKSKSSPSTYLIVPIVIFFLLFIFATLRGPYLISSTGFGALIIVVAPLILATYALTIIVISSTKDSSPLVTVTEIVYVPLYS